MVDSTSVTVISSNDAPDYIPLDQFDKTTAIFYLNALALIKMRQKEVSRLNKIPKDVFSSILGYCWPVMIRRVSEHYNYNAEYPINYIWPESISCLNPITKLKCNGFGIWFKLESGEKNDKDEPDSGFKDLTDSELNSLVIRYYSDNSRVMGFESYNSKN